MERLTTLATATPPLAEPLDMIQAAVRAAQSDHWRGTDSRLRLALNAIEMLVKLAQYQQGRIDRLEAAERGECPACAAGVGACEQHREDGWG